MGHGPVRRSAVKPTEPHVIADQSEYFILTPSKTALETFLYPVRTGLFVYERGYSLDRTALDSFLILYIRDGHMTFRVRDGRFEAHTGQFVLLNCYEPHAYAADAVTSVLWLHFDGINAEPYYALMTRRFGHVLDPEDASYAANLLERLFQQYTVGHHPLDEATTAKTITDLLTEMFSCRRSLPAGGKGNMRGTMDTVVEFIAEHLDEELTVDGLASIALVSKYHFIRQFKECTGYTPHAYILNARINLAKYLLQSSVEPLYRIRARCGFDTYAAFLSAFKRVVGMAPSAYRKSVDGRG